MSEHEGGDEYWKANIRLVQFLLVIWFAISFLCGIILPAFGVFDGITYGGTEIGFWFAQQGSILGFLIIIFFYAWRMNQLDRHYGVDEE